MPKPKKRANTTNIFDGLDERRMNKSLDESKEMHAAVAILCEEFFAALTKLGDPEDHPKDVRAVIGLAVTVASWAEKYSLEMLAFMKDVKIDGTSVVKVEVK